MDQPPGKPTYEPLESKEHQIRVLDVAPGTVNDILECTLRHISLDADPVPSYETISYCWGTSRASAVIRLHGRLVHVPVTSEAAVKRMRRPDQHRTLWIDAICIDQGSKPEKSEQVAFMATVYSKGVQNLVYLGEVPDDMAARCSEAVRTVLSEARAATANFRTLGETLHKSDHMVHSKDGFTTHVDFEALQYLFSLPWFQRLWVLQEVALSPSSLCCLGRVELPLLEVLRTASWLDHKYLHIPAALRGCKGLRGARSMFDYVDSEAGFYANDTILLSNAFSDIQEFSRTEPKDSIYAILGLLNLREGASEPYKDLLTVDYDRRLANVLCDATRFALCQQGSLAALQLVRHRSDYRHASIDRSFSSWTVRADRWLDLDCDPAPLPVFFDASAGLGRPTRLSDTSVGSAVLVLEGFMVDHVANTTATISLSKWSDIHVWLSSAMRLVSDIRSEDQSDLSETSIELAFTVTVEQNISGARAQREDLLGLAKILDTLVGADSHEGVAEKAAKSREFSDKEKAKLEEELLKHSEHRRVFTTVDGRIGIGSAVTEPGDIIVILKGGDTPFILREVHGGFEFVGETYVRGIMEGEAVEAFRARGAEFTEFHVH